MDLFFALQYRMFRLFEPFRYPNLLTAVWGRRIDGKYLLRLAWLVNTLAAVNPWGLRVTVYKTDYIIARMYLPFIQGTIESASLPISCWTLQCAVLVGNEGVFGMDMNCALREWMLNAQFTKPVFNPL